MILLFFIKKFMDIIVIYGRYCYGKLEVRKVIKCGYVVFLKLCCIKLGYVLYKYIWVLFFYLLNGKYLIN